MLLACLLYKLWKTNVEVTASYSYLTNLTFNRIDGTQMALIGIIYQEPRTLETILQEVFKFERCTVYGEPILN